MENKFIKGTRVKASAKAIEHSMWSKRPGRLGTITGGSHSIDCVQVTWDGAKCSEGATHCSFLEIVPEEQKPLQTE